MRHAIVSFALITVVVGCSTPERVIDPLPPDAKPLTYPEIYDRAKRQVQAAQEFFYEDRWSEVERASKAIADTAALTKNLKAEDVPFRHKEDYQQVSARLAKASEALGAAANAKSTSKTSDAFQDLLLAIRDLRPDGEPVKAP